MPKEPYVFKSTEDAVQKLSAYHDRYKLSIKHIEKYDLIQQSVGGNIFRAFQLTKSSGSVIFRSWSYSHFSMLLKKVGQIRSQKDYDDFIINASYSLIKYWEKQTYNPNEKMGFGPASKLVNLLMKSIQESEDYRIVRLDRFLHVPFDKFTLIPLRIIINEISGVPYKINIPQNATMGFVINEELYNALLGAVRLLSKEAGTLPIIYEYWGWNRTH